ncbi:hypothetical protein OHA71_06280 [Streptomyces sp. NBC_00444]|uniref:hypothetical protein n=1 Tax=Streptomyces sp. NBC_00444 TaxID=2975744 RepID=UPI002E201E47
MMCARCDQPIKPGQPYETHDIPRPTGAGATVFLHKRLCPRPPTQTAPADADRARFEDPPDT